MAAPASMRTTALMAATSTSSSRATISKSASVRVLYFTCSSLSGIAILPPSHSCGFIAAVTVSVAVSLTESAASCCDAVPACPIHAKATAARAVTVAHIVILRRFINQRLSQVRGSRASRIFLWWGCSASRRESERRSSSGRRKPCRGWGTWRGTGRTPGRRG